MSVMGSGATAFRGRAWRTLASWEEKNRVLVIVQGRFLNPSNFGYLALPCLAAGDDGSEKATGVFLGERNQTGETAMGHDQNALLNAFCSFQSAARPLRWAMWKLLGAAFELCLVTLQPNQLPCQSKKSGACPAALTFCSQFFQ